MKAALERPKLQDVGRLLGPSCLAVAAGLAVVSSHAHAAPALSDQGLEGRIGVYAHNAPLLGPRVEGGSADVNIELLAPRLPVWTATRLSRLIPRAQVGATLNTAGRTSLVYAGGAWTFDFGGSPWFVEPMLGAAWHDGDNAAGPGVRRLSLGCSPLVHTGLSAGYRISRRWRVMATAEHASNANTCRHNEGLTNIGARLGYAF